MKKVISFLITPFFLVIASENINLQNKNIDIQLLDIKPIKKTKHDYEKKNNLLEKPKSLAESKKQKEDPLNIDGDVGFNKETKTIDSININMGKKF